MNIDFNVTDILPDRWWNLTQDVLSDKNLTKKNLSLCLTKLSRC